MRPVRCASPTISSSCASSSVPDARPCSPSRSPPTTCRRFTIASKRCRARRGGAMNGYSAAALKRLVRPDRVHGSVYTDPRIFDLEMERIFGRAWIYLGHESQLPKPGDFITATVGRQSLIAVRHDDGAVRAFYNRCTHRGNQLAVESCGQVRFFRCAYHGWTFRTDGTLHSIPLKRGYGEARMEGGELAMRAVARVGISRGFIFA